MPESEVIKLIVETFGLPEQPKHSAIPKSLVLDWMQVDDVETLGV
jgi:hypothetical protein